MERGTLLEGIKALTGAGNLTDVYTGTIRVKDEIIKVYLKDLDAEQLFNEAATSVIGRATGLKIPRSFLVFAPRNRFPSTHAPALTNESLLFASEAIEGPTIKVSTVGNDTKFACDLLLHSSSIGDVYCFDDFSVNTDRNTGNIIITLDSSVWYIDHERTLYGNKMFPTSLDDPLVKVTNKLGAWTLVHMSRDQREAAREVAYAFADKLSGLDILAEFQNADLRRIPGCPDVAKAAAFLTQRRPHLRRIAAEALTPWSLT